MDVSLLKHLGNISQLAGVRESTLRRGRGAGLDIAEFYNAAGLRFTVVPDRCMDLYDLSYKGVNLSFQSKNGLVSGAYTEPLPNAFSDQWPGGMLVTCGLDNVGGGYIHEDILPTHGRIGALPADSFGVSATWEGENYMLRANGAVRQTRLYGRNLLLERTIETSLFGNSLTITDRLTNCEPSDEPFMLLYHCNFGYPLLTKDSLVYTSKTDVAPRGAISTDPIRMLPPIDERPEEFYQHTAKTEIAYGALVNPALHLGAYVRFDTKNLPYFGEWKNMRSHDYVLAIEPCNCFGKGRETEIAENTIARIGAYETLRFTIEIGVLDGDDAIAAFLA